MAYIIEKTPEEKALEKQREKERSKRLKEEKDKRVKELMEEGVSKKIAVLLYDLEFKLRHHSHGYVSPPRY